jgi:glycosyltransferase involved in cell wall biosynthesis
MDKVSVIIPTYNRFKYLLNTLDSVKKQDYENIEIIVVNDCSTQKDYYDYNFGDNVKIIHLKENSKTKFGYACAAYVRNIGVLSSTGKYIVFCDDDDIWMPTKISKQLKGMNNTGCKMSCTMGYSSFGIYQNDKKYKLYNEEQHFETLRNIYKRYGYTLSKEFPDIWDFNFIRVHNCIVTSSVVIDKEILIKIKLMKHINTSEDYDCWLKALQHTNCVYIKDPLFYYDAGHAEGSLY